MKSTDHEQRRYMPGLDGIRALAVLAVIAYHLDWGFASGGLLGVEVFFVLSGYLITNLLMEERHKHGSIDLKRFWIRRARRLLPAMLVMLAVVVTALAIADTERLAALRGDLWTALTYTSNWYYIFHQVSYFESFGPPSPFGHLWSLAVEEQFYLLWPLLLAAMILFVAPTRGRLVLLVLAGAAASFAAMALMYDPGIDPSRVYYGTDTRAFGLLIGAAFAIVGSGRRSAQPLARTNGVWLDIVGAIGLIVVIGMIVRTGEYDESLYRGGMLALSIAAACLIAAAASPSGKLGQLFSLRPLRWLGVRSYGIYLWHYPVIVLTNPADANTEPGLMLQFFQVAASVCIAAVSYKYVEEPLRRGKLKLPEARSAKSFLRRERAALTMIGMIFVLCISCTQTESGLAGAAHDPHTQESLPIISVNMPSVVKPSPAPGGHAGGGDGTSATGCGNDTASPVEHANHGATAPNSGGPEPAPGATPDAEPVQKPGTNPDAKPAPEPGTTPESSPSPESTAPGTNPTPSPDAKPTPTPDTTPEPAHPPADITFVGDSVILGAKPSLEKLLPGVVVDGKINRQMSAAEEVMNTLTADNKLGRIVFIALGTNGTFSTKTFNRLLDSLGEDRQIVLVNTRMPDKWLKAVNKMLSQASENRPNVTLMDWHTYSGGHADWFEKDGVHLKPKGAKAYTALVEQTLKGLGYTVAATASALD